MSLFDRIAESHFSRTRDGRTAYHPFGAFGRGRIIDCTTQLKRIRRFHRRQLKFAVPVGFALGMLLVVRDFDPFSIISASAVSLFTVLRVHSLVRGLPRTKAPLGPARVFRRNADITRVFAWVLMIGGALQILASLSLPISMPRKIRDLMIPVAFFGITGIAAIAIGLWLRGILNDTRDRGTDE